MKNVSGITGKGHGSGSTAPVSAIPAATAPVVAFAGWSGSGKTTLIAKLIPAIKRIARESGKADFRIGVIKHDAHGICLTPAGSLKEKNVSRADEERIIAGLYTDTEGKDSLTFHKAGADSVALCGPEGMFLSAEDDKTLMRHIASHVQNKAAGPEGNRTENLPGPLDQALQVLQDMDFILVEGFKNGTLPQIGIARRENGKGLTAQPDRYMALVTDDPDIRENVQGVPAFGFGQTEELAEFIWHVFVGHCAGIKGKLSQEDRIV